MKGRALLAAALTLAGVAVPALPVRAQGVAPPAQSASCSPAAVNTHGHYGAVVSATNSFGLSLLDRLYRRNTSANTFISPTSIATALGMAYDGARGSTAAGIAKALDVRGMGATKVRAEAGALLTALRSSDPRVQLDIANSLWANQGVPFRPAFLQHAARGYGAKVSTLDFRSPEATPTINGWVSCATHGKIPTIVPAVDPTAVMYLLNAVYFHGYWQVPFQGTDTHPAPFTTASGVKVQVPMMHNIVTFPYRQGANYQTISLPYGNGRYNMAIVLPARGTPLSTFERGMSESTWKAWTGGLGQTRLQLSLPRFTVRSTFSLNAPLSGMGMRQAFGPAANFSGMCPHGCHVSEVIHKTYLHVFERGTIAAAATGIVMTGGVMQAPELEMNVDRPFLLAIRDSQTGAILFAGAVSNPRS